MLVPMRPGRSGPRRPPGGHPAGAGDGAPGLGLPPDLVPPDPPWPIVLGIDPGTRRAGYGAVVAAPAGPRLLACGALDAPARLTVAERLARIAAGLEVLLDRLRPSCVAVESAFAARNVRSALRIGEARGLVLAAAAGRGLPVDEIPPASAKKSLVGHGGASKEQVAAMVAVVLGTRIDAPSDATDALALALACLERRRRAALLERPPS